MSYGVELINNYGYQIATMNDVNYVLRSAGQIYDRQFYGHGRQGAICFLNMVLAGFNAPLVFFRPVTAEARISQTPELRNNVPCLNVKKWWNKSVGALQYFIFDRWIPPERSTYGMQIFDAAGSIIFDSGWRFLKLKKVIWLNPGFPNHAGAMSGSNWTNIGNAGPGALAVSMPLARGYIYRASVFGYYCTECVHLDARNNVYCSLIQAGEFLDQTVGFGFTGKMKSQVMVADITGLPTTYNPVPVIQ